MPVHGLLILTAGAGGGAIGVALAGSLDRLYTTRPERTQPSRLRRRAALLPPAMALLWGACALRALDVRHFVLMALFGTALLSLSATDFESHLLPNRVMYPCLVAAVILSPTWPGRAAVPLLPSTSPSWVAAAVGATLSGVGGGLAGAAIMGAVFLVLPGFGLGDVKLGGLIGLILGFPAVFTGLLAGMVLGGLGAGVMLLSGRARLQTAIAYGPYLAGGAILEMLWRR